MTTSVYVDVHYVSVKRIGKTSRATSKISSFMPFIAESVNKADSKQDCVSFNS